MFGLLVKQGAAPWRGWVSRRWPWLVVGLTLLVVLTVRVRLRDMPLERDEGEYAYMGQLMLQGVPPYKEACNMKLPGTYAAYALSMAVFGQSPAGIHLGLMVVNAASIVLLFLLGRRLLDDTAGVAAAVCYALLSLSPSVVGPSAHATHFIVLPALGGALLLLRGVRRAPCGARNTTSASAYAPSTINYPLLLSGLLFGLAFLMKQHGIFFGLFGALYLVGVWLEQWFQARNGPNLPGRTALRPNPEQGRRSRTVSEQRTSTLEPLPPTGPRRLSHFAAGKLAQQTAGSGGEPAALAHLASPASGVPTQTQPPTGEASRGELEAASSKSQTSSPPIPSPYLLSRAHLASSLSVLLLDLGVFGAGLALPYLLTILLLWWAGVLPEFVFWTISYARRYAAIMTAAQGLDMFRSMLAAAVGYNFLLWLLPWAGALVMWWDQRLAAETRNAHHATRPPHSGPRPAHSTVPCPRLFLTLFLLCAFGSISVGLWFRLHYFITLLPALALLTGVAVSRSVWVVRYERTLELFLSVPILIVFVLAIGAALIGNGAVWFSMSPTLAAQEVHGTTAFAQAVKLADFLKANTPKEARIAVLGSEPELFFYSHRRSATKYIYVYPLMERQSFARQMQEEMVHEIERARPDYIVFADDWTSWLRFAGSEPYLDNWWEQYRSANMDLVQTLPIDISRPSESQSGVTDQAKEESGRPKTGQFLLYKRRALSAK